MAKISLRAYNRDIENLIERGQTEEAIAQCRYILKFFPKHIDTYRLLGKTYLESQRYTEAADVLQRVLSAVPDDFVSQLGMSIIREDEGNLDAAIWHMERAFEIQPSNTAVQDELRRLYGRRDGVEPPKVRLTRGALVRMYARGDLYPQAIAEARAALAEAPTRIDIEIILAEMYFASSQKVEAVEVASRLVRKLPFCYAANRILAEILPETARAEDAKAFQQTVSALDPYYTFVSPNAPTPDQVPDNAVTLEQMEWEPGADVPEQPAWASTIGVKLDQEPEEDVPDWLSAIREAKAADKPQQPEEDFFASAPSQEVAEEEPQSPAADLPQAAPAEESDIPEWMREAGWSELTGPEQAPPPLVFEDQEEQTAGEGEPLPADIPDWLKSLAPEEEDPLSVEEDKAGLDMLASLLPDLEGELPHEETPTAESQPAAQDEEPGATEETIAEPAEEADVPEWLREMEMTSSSTTIIGPEDELAEWLSSGENKEDQPEEAEEQSAVDASDSIPAWLAGLEGAEEPPLEPQQPEEPRAAESTWTPEALEEAQQAPELQNAAVPTEDSVLPPDMDNLDDALAWLESLAAQHGADEETLITRHEDRLDSPPEWVREEMEQVEPKAEPGESETLEPAQTAAEIEAPHVDTYEAPEQVSETDKAQAETVEEPAAAETAQELEAEAGAQIFEIAEEQAPVSQETEAAGAQMFRVSEEPVDETPEAAPQAEAVEAESDFPAMPDLDDEAAAFAWLESLAAQHGAEEETLLNKPENRLEKPPEWVKEEAEEEDTAAPSEEPQMFEAQAATEQPEIAEPQAELAEAVEESEAVEAELPDWLNEIAQAEDAPAEGKKEEELLDWFEELDTTAETTQPVETAAEAPAEETQAPAVADGEAEQAEGIPDWLRALEQEEGAPAESAGDMPEWLQEIQLPVEAAGLEELGIASEPAVEQQPEVVPEEPQPLDVQVQESEADTQEIPVRSFTAEEPEAPEESVEEPVAPEAEQPEKNLPLADLFPEEPVEAQPEPAEAEVIELPTDEQQPEMIGTPVAETEVEETDEISQPETEVEVVEAVEVAPLAQAEVEEAVEAPPVEAEPEVVEAPQPAEQPVMETAAPAAAKAPTAGEADPSSVREQALAQLEHGKIEPALEQYNQLIELDQMLDEVVQDLRNALYRHPVDVSLWQALGDAYLHNNQIQDALDSYTKAEELLR